MVLAKILAPFDLEKAAHLDASNAVCLFSSVQELLEARKYLSEEAPWVIVSPRGKLAIV